jgi:hypothetical protein
MKVNDDLLLRHCGYFPVGRLDGGVPSSEGNHYIICNLAGFRFVCNVRVFVESEVKIHQITGDSEMF